MEPRLNLVGGTIFAFIYRWLDRSDWVTDEQWSRVSRARSVAGLWPASRRVSPATDTATAETTTTKIRNSAVHVITVGCRWLLAYFKKYINSNTYQHLCSVKIDWLVDWVKVLHPTRHTVGHFIACFSGIVWMVLKKLILRQQSNMRKIILKNYNRV